jgi:hypothetical protein
MAAGPASACGPRQLQAGVLCPAPSTPGLLRPPRPLLPAPGSLRIPLCCGGPRPAACRCGRAPLPAAGQPARRAMPCRSPMVRSPVGSTSRASLSASEVARSALAGVTARMMALSPAPARASPLRSRARSRWPGRPCGLAATARRAQRWEGRLRTLDVLPGHLLEVLHDAGRLAVDGHLGEACRRGAGARASGGEPHEGGLAPGRLVPGLASPRAAAGSRTAGTARAACGGPSPAAPVRAGSWVAAGLLGARRPTELPLPLLPLAAAGAAPPAGARTGHVHQRQVGHVGRVDGEVDGNGGHGLAAAQVPLRLGVDLAADVVCVRGGGGRPSSMPVPGAAGSQRRRRPPLSALPRAWC